MAKTDRTGNPIGSGTMLFSVMLPRMIPVLLLLTQVLFANPNKPAWTLLLENKPDQAEKVFLKNTKDEDAAAAGEAFRGLASIAELKGEFARSVLFLVNAYEKDDDIGVLTANMGAFVGWRSSGKTSDDRKIYSVLNRIVKQEGLFTGEYRDILIRKYLSEGNMSKARAMAKNLGIISKWKWSGPYDNISNYGFHEHYPPEQEIDFTKEYDGKDGNKVGWYDLENPSPEGWIYMDHHSTALNAVHYFYCVVESPKEQDGYLSFGSSSTFKIFFNGRNVMQDSVFRNTGIDVFMQRVTFKKGDNVLLVKLGHEAGRSAGSASGKANFLIRLLDTGFRTLEKVNISTRPVGHKVTTDRDPGPPPTLPMDSITALMNKRLAKDKDDIDAILSLIRMYNIWEQTARAQALAAETLKRHPGSSLLFSMLGESYQRAHKQTEAEIAMKNAYDAFPGNWGAWVRKLSQKTSEGNPERLLEFIDKSPENFRTGPDALEASLGAYAAQKKKAELLKVLDEMEKHHKSNAGSVEILYQFYLNQGKKKKALDLMTDLLKTDRLNMRLYGILAGHYVQEGNVRKAVEVYQEASRAKPLDPDPYYYRSLMAYNQKDFSLALKEIDKCLGLIPNSMNSYNLKGNILATMEKKAEAVEVFRDAIKFTSDDFTAWESIRALEERPSFESMTPLPDADSIIKASRGWRDSNSTKSGLVSFIEDVYYYPSHSVKQRYFLLVFLPNQKAIENWKEYQVPFNSSYQIFNIDRAVTRKSDGSLIKADEQQNQLVFKSLEPGDFIIVEYSIFNYFQGKMANQAYGSRDFRTAYPAYRLQLRLLTPQNDSIPWQAYGKEVLVSRKNYDDYAVTTFTTEPTGEALEDKFEPPDYAGMPKAVYSTFSNWNEIARWYGELTKSKMNSTIELQALADSLFSGVTDDLEKVRRVHDYISNNITYSYVSFRQSRWVPQAAQDVLATRIGDCKDMSLFAQCLLSLGNVESHLVLVNTGLRYFTDHAYIGPNFNHCILSYMAGGELRFVDLTTRNSALGDLPSGIQGTMALVVAPDSKELITLPVDSPANRTIKRKVEIKILPDRSIEKFVKTERTGVFAAGFRQYYRFKSRVQRDKEMKEVISNIYPDHELTRFELEFLDTLTHSMRYEFAYRAKEAVTVSGNTAIFSVHIPDDVDPTEIPAEMERKWPIDMYAAGNDIADMDTEVNIEIPEGWAPMNLPGTSSHKTENLRYSLEFTRKGKIITIRRNARFDYNRQYSPSEFEEDIKALKKIVAADNIQLVFTVK